MLPGKHICNIVLILFYIYKSFKSHVFLKISSLKDESALTDFSFPQAFHPDSVTLENVCRNQRLLASSLKPQRKQRAQTEKVQSVQNKLKKNPQKSEKLIGFH